MKKRPNEWFRQAEFDMDTAELICNVGRFFYAVFMCHLSLEKALKGLFTAKLGKIPPKTHSLIYLIERMRLHVPEHLEDFMYTLNRISTQIRYPDDLHKMLNNFDEEKTRQLITHSREALIWIKTRL